MGITAKEKGFLYKYKEAILFVLFTVFCGILAAARQSFSEFRAVELWVIVMAVILLVIVPQGIKSKMNKRMALVMLILMTVANLVHAVMEEQYDQFVESRAGSYLGLAKDYFLAMLVVIIVLAVYPKVSRILSSNIAIALMMAANAGIYILLILKGTEVGGVKAWFMGFQLTEPVKLLFIFIIAALLSKKKNVVSLILAILCMAGNAAGLAIISEYGTLMTLGFVFLIFMFVFPNQLWSLAGILAVIVMALIFVGLAGDKIYTAAYMESEPSEFVETFCDRVRSVQDENGETVSGTVMLGRIIEECQSDGILAKDAELSDEFARIKRRLPTGEDSDEEIKGLLTQREFSNGMLSARKALEKLCAYPAFRQKFMDAFCRDQFYGNRIEKLYSNADQGFLHPVKSIILDLYIKVIQRVIMVTDFLSIRSDVLGITDVTTPYQNKQAERAMQIGGLTGAGSHEFIYVPVMESDMVFSEVVSLFGFAMGAFVILMYMVMFREGIRIQQMISGAAFHQGAALGFSLELFIQALIIIAGNLGVFPLTGITLPFISDGSASLLVSVMMIMILLVISSMDINEETVLVDQRTGWSVRFVSGSIRGIFRSAFSFVSVMFGIFTRKVKEMTSQKPDDFEDEIEEDDFADGIDAVQEEVRNKKETRKKKREDRDKESPKKVHRDMEDDKDDRMHDEYDDDPEEDIEEGIYEELNDDEYDDAESDEAESDEANEDESDEAQVNGDHASDDDTEDSGRREAFNILFGLDEQRKKKIHTPVRKGNKGTVVDDWDNWDGDEDE